MKTVIPAHYVPQETVYEFNLSDPDLDAKLAAMFADIETKEVEED